MTDQSNTSRCNIFCGASQEPTSESDHSVQQTLPPRLYTVKQFSARNPAFSEGSLRWLLFNARQNKLEAAVVRVGRRVLIDEDRFFAWLEGQQAHRQSIVAVPRNQVG